MVSNDPKPSTENISGAQARESIYTAYLNRSRLVTGGSVAANWTRDGFWFADDAADGAVILHVNWDGTISPLFDPMKVRAAIKEATGREPSCRGLPFNSFKRLEDDRIEFTFAGARWRLDTATYSVERLNELDSVAKLVSGSRSDTERLSPLKWLRSAVGGYLVDKAETPEVLSPDGAWFASVRCENIILRSTRDGRDLALTRCGTVNRFWDIESLCLKRVPGRPRSVFHIANPWSPDSLTLLAYRRDITNVFRIPRIHWLKTLEEVDFAPFQKAGAEIDCIEPFFLDVRSGRQIRVVLSQVEDRYIQWLAWHPNGFEALLIAYSRDLKKLQIVSADANSGVARILMEETGATAVKNQLEDVFSGAHGFYMLGEGEGFLWLSTRDGWNHIYRYDVTGKLVDQLTSGDWPVHDISNIGTDGYVYFSAAIDSTRPYDVHVCRVPLSGGRVEQLTQETGIHDPCFAPNGQVFLDTHSSVDRPTRTDLVQANGVKLQTLSEMNVTGLKAVGYRAPEEFTVLAADGITELWGVLYKPIDFDSSRKYPVIELIYGGPQLAYAQRFFAINERKYLNLLWALAQLGYITICLDARGTPGRSKAFQDVVDGHWAAGIADHIGGIRQLCARHSWMDAERVGIYGHSWGGYASTCALMEAPEIYHAAVSSEPGYDPWHCILSEPYLGLPQKNRAAYDEADLIGKAAQIKRPLMIVTGTRYNLSTSSAIKMTRALIAAGVDHEFVLVPDATHHFVGAEEDYLILKLTAFFDRHVKNRRVA